jgi:hypothetical protein
MIENNIFIQFIAAIFYLFACLSLGIFILDKFKRHSSTFQPSELVFISLSFILGAGIISSIWLLLALGGLFRLRFILPILAVCAISGFLCLRQVTARTIIQLKNIWTETRTYSWAWQCIAGLGLILLFLGLFSMVHWAGDAVAFYLAVPKIVANSGRLSLLPAYEDFMSVGLQGEMHAAFFMKTGEPVFFKFFSGISSFATALILIGVSGKAGLKRKGKWLVLAAYVTSSAVFTIIGDGKTDIIAASVGIAAYYLAITNGPVSLIGVLCGLAGTMKLSYIVTIFPGIAFLEIWHQIKNKGQIKKPKNNGQGLKNILIKGIQIGGWCLLAALPHFIKNGLLLNAPFAPITGNGIGWMNQDFFGPETTKRLLVLYPLALSWGKFWGQGGNLSPLLLAFSPLALFVPKPRKWLSHSLIAIIIAGLIGMGCWILRFASVLAIRYYFPTLLLFFPACMRCAEYVLTQDTKPKFLKFSSMSCVITILISTGLFSFRNYYNPSRITDLFTGSVTTCDWDWMPGNGYCIAHNEINQIARPGARVYLATWYRYWLNPDLIQCTNGISDIYLGNLNSESLWENIYERGFEYLITDGSRPQLDPEKQTLPKWISAERLNPIDQSIGVYKLEFRDVPPMIKVEVECIRIEDSSQWKLVQK